MAARVHGVLLLVDGVYWRGARRAACGPWVASLGSADVSAVKGR
ncbi:hypothetical protein APY03_3506 [Variovorax sp. WDL1]|nr:hypothetical protein APY03_3506 [Variovorax sp. WDL1]